jgi:IAA-amino acid hydrolase
VFQPAEEGHAGGYYVLKEGVLDDVQAIFAVQSTTKVASKSGICSTGPVVKARFSASNAVVASSSHANVSHRKRHVSGAAMMPKFRMNFR